VRIFEKIKIELKLKIIKIELKLELEKLSKAQIKLISKITISCKISRNLMIKLRGREIDYLRCTLRSLVTLMTGP